MPPECLSKIVNITGLRVPNRLKEIVVVGENHGKCKKVSGEKSIVTGSDGNHF